ncbi:hypothetical protein TNCV_2853671 [Trichonephila clavipes]|uniref:Uncharacterized protein n=1 Tax=Trichonephila clavipes TaxID=2585209 RepID=A0A8X6UV87_TRICX|nr:hypothetical protein TNCV_2853671 [Trichonephila clavipes]
MGKEALKYAPVLILRGLEKISPPKELSLGLDFLGGAIFSYKRKLYVESAPTVLPPPLLQGFSSNNSNPMIPWSTAPARFDCSPHEHPRYILLGQ